MFEFTLALRYLRSRRARRLARFTAGVAIVGIACGVGALIVATALANGFRDEIRDKILRGTAHITVTRGDGQLIADWRETAARVREVEGVAAVSATSYDGALIAGAEQAAYAVLRGVDVEEARALDELSRGLVAGKFDLGVGTTDGQTGLGLLGEDEDDAASLPGAVIGADLAARTGLRVGDVGKIISAQATLADPESVPQQHRVRVAGIFRTGLYEYDATWVYISLATAARFGGAGVDAPPASALSLETVDPQRVAPVAGRVRERLGAAFAVVDWREANRPLFAALSLERRVILVVIALIVLIAALNIATSLALLVVERRPDIAILGALGARPGSVMLIFLLEGALIGILGAAAGVALGLTAVWLGNHYELISLPADVYSISVVPLRIGWREIAAATSGALALSVLATVYPALTAARVRPAEALRYD